MTTKQLILNDGSHPYHNYSVFLKDFDPKKLKIIGFDCGDSYIYHVNYVGGLNNVNPLYLVIPEVLGFIECNNGCKYLNFAPAQVNEDVLVNYEPVQNEIMNRVTEMAKNTYLKSINEVSEAKRSRASETSDNFDIALGTISGNNTEYVVDLPLDKLIKVTAMTISCSYVLHKNSGFYPRVSLQETLYDDYWPVI